MHTVPSAEACGVSQREGMMLAVSPTSDFYLGWEMRLGRPLHRLRPCEYAEVGA
jgi:hypothetical protein